jgi:uncharacterized protein (DUF305 family)
MIRQAATVAVAMASVMAATGLSTALGQHGQHHMSASPAGQPVSANAFARQMNAGMDRMMQDMHRPGHTGNPDIDFLAMMIPHHEGAVEMARLLLIHGKDPLTRRLAEEIIASQTTEIAAMRQRLAILREGSDSDPGGFPALYGTRGSQPAGK